MTFTHEYVLPGIMHGLLGKRDKVICPLSLQMRKFRIDKKVAERLAKAEKGR